MAEIFKNDDMNRTIKTTDNDSISDNDDYNNQKITFTYKQLCNSIPSFAIDKYDDQLITTHIEHRWRFFNINSRKLVEITVKHPNKERKYINSCGEWVEFNLDSIWEKYITSSKYYYSKI